MNEVNILSTDNKKLILMLFVAIDFLLGVLILKSDPTMNLETKDIPLKNKGNAYTISEPQEIIVEEEEIVIVPEIVYDNLTYDELVSKLNRTLSDDLSGKGDLIASKSLELGVDPYLATAIMMHETGCTWGCSYLVKACNNVGGQKGYGCGEYSSFATLDDGIVAMITNLYNNYYLYGLTTPETINPKYAEDPNWSNNINNYIIRIKNT